MSWFNGKSKFDKNKRNSNTRKTSGNHFAHRHLKMEALEDRNLLSVTTALNGDLLVDGTAGNDTIVLNGTANPGEVEVVLNGVSEGTYTPAGSIFLNGHERNDVFEINETGNVGLVLDGQQGFDTFNVHLSGLHADVTVSDTGIGKKWRRLDLLTVIGTAGDDAITVNGGTIADVGSGKTITFDSSVEFVAIDGGAGVDTVSFTGYSPSRLTLEDFSDYEFHGTSGNDRMSFGAGKNGDLVYRLNKGNFVVFSLGAAGHFEAYGEDGNDKMQMGGRSSASVWFFGGAGNDHLGGGNGDDVLDGEDGNDKIEGGKGRDLEIGGDGSDKMQGNSGDDIMISGWLEKINAGTQEDETDDLIDEIMDDWDDEGDSEDDDYDDRSSNLQSLTNLLDYIFDDDDHDIMTGNGNQDLFFCNVIQDKGPDKKSQESEIDLS